VIFMKIISKIICVLILLTAGLLLAGCQNQGQQSHPIVGGDKDSHGCIPSAGYSWCDAKQKCIRQWEENCTAEQQLAGKYRDSHGCIVSSGYSWCDAKQKCIRSWKEKCTNANVHICTQKEKQNKICTMEYIGVCGSNGVTYGNGCSACSAKVNYYIMGVCAGENKIYY
jgi:hypothetical protein